MSQIVSSVQAEYLRYKGLAEAAIAQLSDAIATERRASAQGFADLAMGLAGASAGALSGVIVGAWGYPVLTLLAAVAAAGLIAILAIGR